MDLNKISHAFYLGYVFGLGRQYAKRPKQLAQDKWEEQKHPRDEKGQFAKKGISRLVSLPETISFSERKTKKGKVLFEEVKISELPEDLRAEILKSRKSATGQLKSDTRQKYEQFLANQKADYVNFATPEDVNRAKDSLIKKELKDLASTDKVKNFHKQRTLRFKSIPVSDIRLSKTAIPIHKSTSYNRSQGSAYFLDVIDGRPAYVRISNHWGNFSTNVYEWDEEGKGKEGDQFGRVGTKLHTWELVGGSNEAKKSQAGYIFLDEE